MRGEAASPEQGMREGAAGEGMSIHNEFVPGNFRIDTHLCEHFQYGLATVAFLVGKPAHTGYSAGSLAEGSKHCYYREEIRAVGGVHLECAERRSLHVNETFRVVVPHLGEAGACLHQYVHNGEVRLQRLGIQTGKLNSSKYGTGHEEVCGRTPVPLDVHIRGLVGLASLDVESD